MTAMFHSLYNRTAASLAPNAEQSDKAFLNWPASYLDGFQAFDPEHYRLQVDGLVEKPQQFSLKEMSGFMRIQQNRRLVFADGLTYKATWEGFVVNELLHRVTPKPEAKYLIQTNLAGHVECLPLKELFTQRALFCLKIGGKSLPAIYGGPLRLMVFDRYAHKGLGQIVHLELSDVEVAGHFAEKGYNPTGEIEPGNYYATDLQSIQLIKTPGEVTQW